MLPPISRMIPPTYWQTLGMSSGEIMGFLPLVAKTM